MRKLRILIGIFLVMMLVNVKAQVLSLSDYESLNVERAYIIGNYLFDISNGYNPSLKDLLISASYENKDNIKVYYDNLNIER